MNENVFYINALYYIKHGSNPGSDYLLLLNRSVLSVYTTALFLT